MMTHLTAGLAVLVLATGCARTAQLSAAEVAARNADARGGIDAWRKVQTMVWTGHVESDHARAPSMPFELDQKRPNKTRLQLDAPGDRSVRVFNGLRGWKLHPGRGRAEPQPFTPQEVMYAQAGHGLDGPLIDYAAKGNSVALEGLDELEGRKAYHLSVHLAKGATEDVWVDAETFLDVRCDRKSDGPDGAPRRVSVTYGDYRAVAGLRLPFLISTGGGVTPDRMQIERVLLNTPLDDSTFESPAAPHSRHRSRPGIARGTFVPTPSGDEGGLEGQ